MFLKTIIILCFGTAWVVSYPFDTEFSASQENLNKPIENTKEYAFEKEYASVIPDHYYHTKGTKYFVSQDWKTWEQAKEVCKNDGMVLASIETQTQQKELIQFIRLNNLVPEDVFAGYWLSGTISGSDTWRWDTTGREVNYGWLPGEPNYYKGEDCLELKNDGWLMGWNNYYCNENRRYICEKPSATSEMEKNSVTDEKEGRPNEEFKNMLPNLTGDKESPSVDSEEMSEMPEIYTDDLKYAELEITTSPATTTRKQIDSEFGDDDDIIIFHGFTNDRLENSHNLEIVELQTSTVSSEQDDINSENFDYSRSFFVQEPEINEMYSEFDDDDDNAAIPNKFPTYGLKNNHNLENEGPQTSIVSSEHDDLNSENINHSRNFFIPEPALDQIYAKLGDDGEIIIPNGYATDRIENGHNSEIGQVQSTTITSEQDNLNSENFESATFVQEPAVNKTEERLSFHDIMHRYIEQNRMNQQDENHLANEKLQDRTLLIMHKAPTNEVNGTFNEIPSQDLPAVDQLVNDELETSTSAQDFSSKYSDFLLLNMYRIPADGADISNEYLSDDMPAADSSKLHDGWINYESYDDFY